jgi:hypothetical protein
MVRFLLLSIGFSLCASVCSAQSVADAARQAKKDKDAPKASKKVYTTDDVSSAQPEASPLDLRALDAVQPASSGLAARQNSASSPDASNQDQSKASEEEKELSLNELIDALDHEIEELDGMDGPAVAKLVLGDNLDVPFDGRRDWEYKMLDAKKELVLSEKEILRELKRLRDGHQFNAAEPIAALRAALQKARMVEEEGRSLARAWLLKSR